MRIKKYAGSIYKRLNYLFSYQFDVYKRKGAYFLLNNQSMMDDSLIKFKDYEEDLLSFAEKTIKEDQITHFFDVGANLGYYTIRLGKIPPVQKIYSFEPHPSLYIQMSSNILINDLLAKWKGFNFALSDHTGKARIYYHPYYLGTTSLEKGWRTRSNHSVEIDLTPFDELIDVKGKRCFLKIDVEGSEVGVLDGMKKFLAENDVFMQIETENDKLQGVTSILEALGFTLKGHPSDNDYYFSNYTSGRGREA